MFAGFPKLLVMAKITILSGGEWGEIVKLLATNKPTLSFTSNIIHNELKKKKDGGTILSNCEIFRY